MRVYTTILLQFLWYNYVVGLGLKYDNCVAGRAGPGHTFCEPGRAGPGPHNSVCGPGPGLGLKSYLRAEPGPKCQARTGS